MIARTVLIATGLVAVLATKALAGPCTEEIDAMAQAISSAGQHAQPKSPTTSGQVPDNPLDTTIHEGDLASAAAMPKAPATAGQLPDNPLSPQAAAPGSDAAGALQRARDLDQLGDEAGCMDEIGKAKALLGSD